MPQALASGRLKRTTSTPQILESTSQPSSPGPHLPPRMTNGVISTTRGAPTPVRFATSPSQRGLMHRFLATRGKMGRNGAAEHQPMAPITITLNPESIKAFNRSLEIRGLQQNGGGAGVRKDARDDDDEPKRPPTRKGFVPVEKKIQRELSEMKERENELR